MELLLNPKTKLDLKRFAKQPYQGLLIVGPAGSGKATLCNYLATTFLGINEKDNLTNPNIMRLKAEGSISIDDIRSLHAFTSLKTIGRRDIRRIIIIEKADTMTIEAQNAFLKLLEEPPADTAILMTAVNQRALLPTVLSRVQKINVGRLTKSEIINYFSHKNSLPTDLEQAYSLSEGNVGLMASILEKSQDHNLVKAIELAKELISSPTYVRLAKVDDLAKDKENLGTLLDAMARISRIMMREAGKKQQKVQMAAWHQRLTNILKAKLKLTKNAQPRLLLTDLLLNL